MRGLFITGTDTSVGKTFVACAIARSLRAAGRQTGIYKPVCSGADRAPGSGPPYWPDVAALSASLDGQFPEEWICPQRFLAPLAPPTAAAKEHQRVDAALLRTGVDVWRNRVDALLVEGVGGWRCPLTEEETVADLARDLAFPVLIVAANRLGTINHTLLTANAVHDSGLPIAGIVLNDVQPDRDASCSTNAATLRRFLRWPVYGPLPHHAAEGAHELGAPTVDWTEIMESASRLNR